MGNIDFEAIHDRRGCIRYWKSLTHMAKQNRKSPTEAERRMWNDFLSYNKTGYRFLRQKPIYRFIVDFYCVKLNLAIEIDGSSHVAKKENDLERDNFLNRLGLR